MPEFRLVAVYQVTADDKTDAVRKWNALTQGERAQQGWLNRLDELQVEEAGT